MDDTKKLEGMRIEFASSERIQFVNEVGEQFMKHIFNMEPGDYFYTDDSTLNDFLSWSDSEKYDVQRKEIIAKTNEYFGVDITDQFDGYLREIFCLIAARRKQEE